VELHCLLSPFFHRLITASVRHFSVTTLVLLFL